jgi:hypothetical protein
MQIQIIRKEKDATEGATASILPGSTACNPANSFSREENMIDYVICMPKRQLLVFV